jgi:ubiquinone/menaquinone biosynthesis C-methylase UbiE/DNA-binding transcriptional ArsR family regulator
MLMSMGSFLRSLRLLGDPTRIRLLLLLEREELSVAELQEILAKGQSQISTQLSQLKQAALIEDRREGKNIFYRLEAAAGHVADLYPLLRSAAGEIPEAEEDAAALRLVLENRRDRMRGYFDEMAGRFGREYIPGRSWQGLAEALLTLMPPMVIADLGAGQGTFSQLLARRAKKVIAVDNSKKMVRAGAVLARKRGLKNLDYRLGDMESVPIADEEVDLAFFSQALHHSPQPQRAIEEAWRILRPGGRIAILDLLRHQFEKAREMYADVWLGFTEAELRRFVKKQGFRDVYSAIVHKEADTPHFETILLVGEKPEAVLRMIEN